MSQQKPIGPDHPLYPVMSIVQELSRELKLPFALLVYKEPKVSLTLSKPTCGCAHHEMEFIATCTKCMEDFASRRVIELAPQLVEEMLHAAAAARADANLAEGQAKVSAKDAHLASFLSKPAVDGGNNGK